MGRSSHLSFARAVPIALLLVVAAPAVAHADATITVTGTAPHKTLTFTVDDALNHETIVLTGTGSVFIDDSVGVASGCTPYLGMWDCGPTEDFERLVFTFGAGNDHLDLSPDYTPIRVTADGGAGNDVLDGGT